MKILPALGLAICLAVAAAAACHPSSGQDLKTDVYLSADSTAHSSLSIKAELPLPGQGAAAERIRTALIQVMDVQMSHIGTYEEDRLFPAFGGESDDTHALMEYYRGKSLETIGQLSQEDFDERVKTIKEEEGLSEAEMEEILSGMPGLEYDFSLLKNRETDRYVIFLSEDYFYLGGAHGGITGCGGLTFDKKDGHLVERFLELSSLKALQPLLRKGLTDYFTDDGEQVTPDLLDDFLFLESGIIPFPSWTPFPSEDGLVFTYQQYEIAAYAAGMPSFTLPYDDILPYLTPEAKELLGLSE